MSKLKIETARRQTIENVLLSALADEGSVAMILSEKDLDLVIDSIAAYSTLARPVTAVKLQEMLADIRILRDSTFGKASPCKP